MTETKTPTLFDYLGQLRTLVTVMNRAPDRIGHDKRCHWCAECGDNLLKMMDILEVMPHVTLILEKRKE
jgi:hypothetical protein